MTALQLRALLTQTHVDQNGRAVVYADRVAAVLARRDDVIDRLVQHLATATGRTPDEVRVAEGIDPAPRRPLDRIREGSEAIDRGPGAVDRWWRDHRERCAQAIADDIDRAIEGIQP